MKKLILFLLTIFCINAFCQLKTLPSRGGVTFPLRGGNGSAAAPSYSFTAASGMGWYALDTQSMAWACAGARTFSFSCTDTAFYLDNYKLYFSNGATNTGFSAPASGGGQLYQLPTAQPTATGEVLRGSAASTVVMSWSTGFVVNPTGSISPVGVAADPCGNTTNFPADSVWVNTTNHVLCICVAGASKRASDGSTSCF